MKFSLSWIYGVGMDARGGSIKQPSWQDIDSCLNGIFEASGSVTLDAEHVGGYDIQTLQVIADDKAYFMTLGLDDGNDYTVHPFHGENKSDEIFYMLGDMVDSSCILYDFNIVIKAFRDLYENGVITIR